MRATITWLCCLLPAAAAGCRGPRTSDDPPARASGKPAAVVARESSPAPKPPRLSSPPPWASPQVRELSTEGLTVFVGSGAGDTRAAAYREARADALGAAARTIRAEVRSQFDSIREELRVGAGGGDVQVSTLAHAQSRTHTRAASVIRGAREYGRAEYRALDGGKTRCWLRLSLPTERVYAHRRLLALVRGDGPDPAQRARKAMQLSRAYRVQGSTELAGLAVDLAAQWDPASPEPLRLRADLAEEDGDIPRAILALDRLADLLKPPEKLTVRDRAARLRGLLLPADDVLSALIAGCRRRADDAEFAFSGETRGRELLFSFAQSRSGYITCLWIDGDGVASWTPTDKARGNNFWTAGEHVLLPVPATGAGKATVIAFLTSAPETIPGLPIAPAGSADMDAGARVRKMYALNASVKELCALPETACAVTEVSLR